MHPESRRSALENLLRDGLITQEEFDRAVAQRAGLPPPPPLPPGREKPPHSAEPPPVGATEPTLAGADVMPPAVPQPPPPPLPPPPAPALAPDGLPPGVRYPMRFEVDYPERLSRWSTGFRLFLLIPLWLLGYILQYLFFGAWLAARVAVILRRTYPAWLFTGAAGYLAWNARYQAYLFLQTDRHPSFAAEDHPVRLEYEQPRPGEPGRWHGILVRLVMIIPHFVVLAVLWFGVAVVVVIAWFAILFTGRYPRGMFGFVTGVSRWQHRVAGYFAGFTDRVPPFSRDPVAGSASGATVAASAVLGTLAIAGIAAGVTAGAVWQQRVKHADVNYADLEGGEGGPTFFVADLDSDRAGVVFTLSRVTDPGDRLAQILDPAPDERLIVFEWHLTTGDRRAAIDATPARLKVREAGETEWYGAELVTLGGGGAPATLGRNGEAILRVVFVVPADAEPLELRFDPAFHPRGGVAYEFR